MVLQLVVLDAMLLKSTSHQEGTCVAQLDLQTPDCI